MEALTIIGLVGNIVQFVDFSSKLISTSTQLYGSAEGALAENVDIEAVTNDLVLLSNSLKDTASNPCDEALKSLSESCHTVAEQLLVALDKVKAKGKHQRLESIRKAVRSVWNKQHIEGLERRLARFREELNLRVVVDLRCVPRSRSISRADNLYNKGTKFLSSSSNTRTASKTSIPQERKSSMLLSSNRMSFKRYMTCSLLQ
jgi:hypothetical protein